METVKVSSVKWISFKNFFLLSIYTAIFSEYYAQVRLVIRRLRV